MRFRLSPGAHIQIKNKQMENTMTFDFGDGKGAVSARLHPNGGGWVAESAKVDETVYVSQLSMVYGEAEIRGNVSLVGNVRVFDKAHIHGVAVRIQGPYEDEKEFGCLKVFGSAQVLDNVLLIGNVKVCENSVVRDYAIVKDHALAAGSCVIGDFTVVQDRAIVRESAQIKDQTIVRDNAHVYGQAKIGGTSLIRDECEVYGKAVVENEMVKNWANRDM